MQHFGELAEWLRSGLQIRAHRFDSGTRLHLILNQRVGGLAVVCDTKWHTSLMMLSSYLSPSRHGIYYFRWPIPPSVKGRRTTVRIFLRTRCPDQVGDLARHLASCARLIRENRALAGLQQHEIREKVQIFFKAQLDQYLDWLDRRGLPKNALADAREEVLDHESFMEINSAHPVWLPVARFKRKMKFPMPSGTAALPGLQPSYGRDAATCSRAFCRPLSALSTIPMSGGCPGYCPCSSCSGSVFVLGWGGG